MEEQKPPRFSPIISEQQMGQHVDEIVKRYRGATKDHIDAGTHWYEKAHEVANKLGGGDARKGAGIISALSPLTNWDVNLRRAHELVKTGDTKAMSYNQTVGKAKRILAGENPDELFDEKSGPKTHAFYHNIANPGNPIPVTVDRHAYDIAVGQKGAMDDRHGNLKGLRYNHFADAYRNATHKLDLEVPNQVQAVTWMTQPKGRGLRNG
jgi:hypothetical protein